MAMAQDRTAVLISTLVLFSLVAVDVSVAVDFYAFEQPIYRVVEGTDSVAVVFIVRTGLHRPESSSVDVATSDGSITGRSALAGTDYTAVSTTVMFTTAGDNRRTVSIPIIDNTIDNTDEDIHCFTLTLSNPFPSDGILGSPALVCIIDNDNFFLGTCPPPQAVIESNGEPVVEVIAPTGSTTATVSWTDPTPGANLRVTYQCFSGTTAITPCVNGGNFPISSTFSDYNGRILVQYTTSTSFMPTVVIHSCDFYIRVHDDPSLHLTMVTPTPFGARSLSGTSISCFRSPPDTSSPLSFGRPFQFGIPGSTIQTSTSLPAGRSPSDNGAAITQHLTTSVDATGLFYCQGINRGLTTRVYSIIHNIQTLFEPADGLVTKTVNIRESVTLSVTGVNNPPNGDHAPLWRQISNGVVVMEGSGFQFTLTASAANDGDLFAVIQSAATLGDNHFSMIRLIVRGCAAGKWGPPGCVGVCDQCYNGGVCDDETGKCICPPGFMGTNCLNACGMHRFGWNCELQCGPGNIIQSCTGSQFGLPDPYGNSCISGYMGRDCDISCDPGMFGAGCTQMCHCQQGASCDRFTGECTPIGCQDGWSGQSCQIHFCDSQLCFNGGTCLAHGSAASCQCPGGFTGAMCQTVVNPCVPTPCLNGGACRQIPVSTFACTCSEGYSGHTCEIDDPCVPSPCLNGGICQRQVSTFVCQCSAGLFGKTCWTLSPSLSQAPTVTGTSTSATISWLAWGSIPMDTGEDPITAYKVYYSLRMSPPDSWIEAGNVSVTNQTQSMYMLTVGQLQPDTEYLFSVAAVGTGGAEGPQSPSASYVTLSLPIPTIGSSIGLTTVIPPIPTQDPTMLASTEPSSQVPIIASVVAVFVILIIIILILIMIMRRLRRSRTKEVLSNGLTKKLDTNLDSSSLQTIDNPIMISMEDITSTSEATVEPASPQQNSTTTQAPEPDKNSPFVGLPLLPREQKEFKRDPISVRDFPDYVHRSIQTGQLKDEWISLPGLDVMCSCDTSQFPDNKVKNRYRNILAYDHCRVVLEGDDPNKGYINASYIKGYKKDKAYIATQGPNQATSHDFWKMVWQENVHIIIMGTNLVEDGKIKCVQYWPEKDKPVTLGGILIDLQSEESKGEYVVRTMSIGNKSDTEIKPRLIKQFHYKTWPDKDVPKDATPVLKFIQDFTDETPKGSGPYLVHCSAGVGRTGAIIAIHASLQRARIEKTLDIYNFVADMRNNRVSIVQTPAQYTFIHWAVLESLFSGNTTIPAESFKEKFTKMKKKGTFEEEMKKLDAICPMPTREKCRTSLAGSNESKNRFSNTLVAETCRPFLMTPREDGEEYNYINAAYVDGFQKDDVAIITQAPLPNTILDMWRMVYDYQLTSVVMLNALDPSDTSCPQYWPDEGSEEYGPFTVTIEQTLEQGGFKTRFFQLIHRRQKRMLRVRHYQFTDWPLGQETPKSPDALLRLLVTVERNKSTEIRTPILIHCIDGLNRSGAFCVLKNSLERLEKDDTVDIMQTLKVLRLNRPYMLSSLELYKFCYEAMQVYIEKPERFKDEPIYQNTQNDQQESIYQNVEPVAEPVTEPVTEPSKDEKE